ncbi:GumC family protein [Chitinophaga flava]|uniref:non-specific protein-tyrosine kinase n=1 Tax=Chitinophaga flava TaxID=2259036 RepID=A0A365XVB2_9BACT|nr:polysaccharide biosynthesis tyrosine autokinase [Chitinophaga flava]RBL89664.1 capsular biosynthesis protein [Chitinophaga flava]
MQHENIYSKGQHSANGHSRPQESNERVLDLRSILDKVLSNWYWFVLCGILTIALAWVYLRYATPGYLINAKILVQDQQKGGNIPGEELFQQLELFSNKSNVDNEVEILKSRSLMEKVVNSLELNVRYFTEGRVKKTEVFNKRPFSMHWLSLKDTLSAVSYTVRPQGRDSFALHREDLSLRGAWGDTIRLPEGVMTLARHHTVDSIEAEYDVNVVSIDNAVADLMTQLNVSIPNKQVSTIDLALTTTIPGKGEEILNTLIDAYRHASVEDKNRIADSTIDFIDKRLRIVSTELLGVERNIQQFKQDNQLADLTEQSKLLVSGTGDNLKQLTDAQVKLNVINSMEEYIRDEKNNKRIVPSSMIVQDPTFVGLVEKYNTLQLERERQLLASTPSNPVVVNLDRQLSGIRGDLASNIQSFRKGVELSIEELQRNSNSLSQRIRKVPAAERVFLDFSRQQAIKQDLYVFLLKKREESAISKTSNLAIARIIDPAKSDALPFKPKRIMVYLLALMAGAGIPALWIYVRGLLNTRIQSREDIKALTPVPVLAEIGHCSDKQSLVVSKDGGSHVAEQFRALRTNLQFILSGKQDKVVLLTSSMSGEGKSFVAINLAAVLAYSGKKVVLMEMDLRKPKISDGLGISNHTGFSSYAIGRASINEIVQPSGIHENLKVVSSGPVPPNPAELMLLESTEHLFTELRRHFDYIIIDTAPVGLVTDAQLLGRFADATLYLVRQGYTFRQQLEVSKDLYLYGKMPKINLVINDVKASRSSGYGGYGYGYGYGYGHENTQKKKGIKKLKSLINN